MSERTEEKERVTEEEGRRRRREGGDEEGDAEGPIVMGVTIESGVSIVNQYPDTAAGASRTRPVCSSMPIHTSERTLHRAVGCQNTRF